MVGPKRTVSDESDAESKTLYGVLGKWLSAQEFNNVLLMAMLASGAGFVWYGIPQIVGQINEHLTRIEQRHREERQAIEEQHGRQIHDIVELVRDTKFIVGGKP